MPEFQITRSTPPLPRTYWVLDGKFLAGAYAGQADPIAHMTRLKGVIQRWLADLCQFNGSGRKE